MSVFIFEVVWTLVVLIVGILMVVLRLRRRTPPPPYAPLRYDERYWGFGGYYNNPNDPEPFVPPRGLVRSWWVPNWGHPVGRLFGIASLVMAVVVIFLFLLFLAVVLGPAFVHSLLGPGISAPRFGFHPSACSGEP